MSDGPDARELARSVEAAREIRRNNDHEAAERILRGLLTQWPNCVGALRELRATLEERDDRDGAREVGAALQAAEVDAQLAIARRLYELDKLDHAEVCLRALLSTAPNSIEAHNLLGLTMEWVARYDDARDCFAEAVRLDPENEEFQFKLASFGGGRMPDRTPAFMIVDMYQTFAETYEQTMLENLDYQGPNMLFAAVRDAAPDHRGDNRILDLGCGTGLNGQRFHPIAKRLHGIDLSAAMLARAAKRGIYDSLIEGDVVEMLACREERDDIIVSSDALVYLGDLSGVFSGGFRCLGPGGILAFTLEQGDEPGYVLKETGRYVHDKAYLAELAQYHGFNVAGMREVAKLRTENSVPVRALISVFRRMDG